MKEIRVYFEKMWKYFDETDQFYQILLKNYDVVLCERPEDADYVICSVFNLPPYEFCKVDKIRILYSGENYIPDFNLIDYGISSYPLTLGDRHFCMPRCIDPFEHFAGLSKVNRTNPAVILNQKKYFANFVSNHESEFSIRGDFFKKLCEYKRVEYTGGYLNNLENGRRVNFKNNSKVDFQAKCKFSLCFESTKHDGFITEKITDAFFANTIPIYYGSDMVKEIFNPKAFINVTDFQSFDEAIEKIKEIDQDDEKYKEMISQPILINPNFYEEKTMAEMEEFVCNIFDQPLEKAYRRSRIYTPREFEKYILYRMDNKQVIKEIHAKEMLKEISRRLIRRF